jgi:mannose-6-phosphate isomerase-like protein (cupin superfamily)
MSLFCKKADIPVGKMDMGNTSFTTTLVHGNNASLMLAERPGKYHSRPHSHDCEQLNLLMKGQLHVFMQDNHFLLNPGDVLRLPANVIHWAWNKSEEPCVLLEVHSPGLQSDPILQDLALGLFDTSEQINLLGTPNNQFVDPASVDIEKSESLKSIGG